MMNRRRYNNTSNRGGGGGGNNSSARAPNNNLSSSSNNSPAMNFDFSKFRGGHNKPGYSFDMIIAEANLGNEKLGTLTFLPPRTGGNAGGEQQQRQQNTPPVMKVTGSNAIPVPGDPKGHVNNKDNNNGSGTLHSATAPLAGNVNSAAMHVPPTSGGGQQLQQNTPAVMKVTGGNAIPVDPKGGHMNKDNTRQQNGPVVPPQVQAQAVFNGVLNDAASVVLHSATASLAGDNGNNSALRDPALVALFRELSDHHIRLAAVCAKLSKKFGDDDDNHVENVSGIGIRVNGSGNNQPNVNDH